MKLSKTSEYALRILTYMARDSKKIYSARGLVEDLRISDKYLRRLMTSLSKSGIIRSVSGRDGGYIINKELDKIKLMDIIDVVEGADKYTGCVLGFKSCSDENPCIIHDSWVKVRSQLTETFEEKTLANLKFSDKVKY